MKCVLRISRRLFYPFSLLNLWVNSIESNGDSTFIHRLPFINVLNRGGQNPSTRSPTANITSTDSTNADPLPSVLLPSVFTENRNNRGQAQDIYITKRNGQREELNLTKLEIRLRNIVSELSDENIDISSLRDSIVRGLYNGVASDDLDVLAAETAAALGTQHPSYAKLAAQIVLTRNRKLSPSTFSQAVNLIANDDIVNEGKCFLHPDLIDLVQRRGPEIDDKIAKGDTMDMTYFGFKTLERAYLLRTSNSTNRGIGEVVERPEYLMMRVALGIHCCDYMKLVGATKYSEDDRLRSAFETYDYLVQGYFTHASPTLFHSGTTHPQLSSCFLVQMREDSIVGIYDTLRQCALISKSAGGIGLSVHNIRARGTPIRGTRGVSNGLVPMLRVYDVTSRYVDQGGGKRPGAFAIYIEPWHADVFDVLNLKKNHGKEEQRARDLFYGLWIPDLFMKRVEDDGVWSLMCPQLCRGMSECYGKRFDELYQKYERDGQFVRQVRARDLWIAILESQIETGTPYMLYKDACNAKSNQKNLGTIQCSNLCTEIIQYTSKDEVAVCNLACLCLSRSVVSSRGKFGSVNKESGCAYFDHEALHRATKIVTRNLNKIIDINSYPVPESQTSNFRHRPVGIGVCGLADTFLRLGLPFTSDEAKQLNTAIFETIYHAALEASTELAEIEGTYETFHGCPASEGKLQFNLWDLESDDETPSQNYLKLITSGKSFVKQVYPESITATGYDWHGLRQRIIKNGLRNSLLVAPMPTASTSQILGVNECFEPFSSNLYVRRVKAGEFIIANPHLLQDLTERGMWTQAVRNQMMRDCGSIQNIAVIPNHLKELYKTVWEIRMKDIIDMAADRGKFVDQSQSLNLFLADPSVDKLTAMHFYAWKKGMKTGMYYLRTKPAVNAIQYTVEKKTSAELSIKEETNSQDDICLSCQG
jgi:ribonucleoside-diphosphate reductase alpha subunit